MLQMYLYTRPLTNTSLRHCHRPPPAHAQTRTHHPNPPSKLMMTIVPWVYSSKRSGHQPARQLTRKRYFIHQMTLLPRFEPWTTTIRVTTLTDRPQGIKGRGKWWPGEREGEGERGERSEAERAGRQPYLLMKWNVRLASLIIAEIAGDKGDDKAIGLTGLGWAGRGRAG